MDPEANLAREVVARVADRAKGLAKDIANGIGGPIDASTVDHGQVKRLWNLQNPQADMMQVQQLLAKGMHGEAIDMVYPWRNKLIGKGSPQRRVDRANYMARVASEE
jgi:hypothetical protein